MRLSTRHLKLRLTELLIGLFIVTVIVIVLAVVVEALFGRDASAQSPTAGLACGSRLSMSRMLESKYGEKNRFAGVSHDGLTLMELYFDDNCSTWTMTVTGPDKITCLVAEGLECQVFVWPLLGEPL